MYSVEMLSMKYGESAHEVRRALMASGVDIDQDDKVKVDAAEKADDKVKKFLDDHNAQRAEDKAAVANMADIKAKFAEEHNAKISKGEEE